MCVEVVGRQNCGQILKGIFIKFYPYRLLNGQLFCLLLMQQKLDPGVPNATLILDFLDPNWLGKIILHFIVSNIFLKWAELPINDKNFRLLSYTSYFGGITWPFFKYFNEQIRDILIFRLTFASYFKTMPFCKPCVFIKDKNNSVQNF